MKCKIRKITARNFYICEFGNNNHMGIWYGIEIPEEVYEEIRNKLHGKPYTGIHAEIVNSNRSQVFPVEVILDYLYCNGFDYLFEE